MIPDLVDIGGPWKVLPKGIYDATLNELKKHFVTNITRRKLFGGLLRMLKALKKVGCSFAYINGSFTTEKENPGDFDICWDTTGVDPDLIDPVLLEFHDKRRAQKMKYFGECFPTNIHAGDGLSFLEYFQRDRFTGKVKGIIKIKLK